MDLLVLLIRNFRFRTKNVLTDWVLFIFSGLCFVLTLFIPETLAPVLLRRKAQKLRKNTGVQEYRTLEELERKPFSETLKIALVRPFIMLFKEPIVTFMSFCESIPSLRSCRC